MTVNDGTPGDRATGDADRTDGADDGGIDGAGDDGHSRYRPRIEDLAADARAARKAFEAPADPPDEARALECARDGLGPVVALYVEARTAGAQPRFSAREHDLLDRATNDWLAQYAACYGVDMDPGFTVREAAEVLIDTHDVGDVAALLTSVPDRTG